MKLTYLIIGVLLIGSLALVWFSLNLPDLEIVEVQSRASTSAE